ncbi:HAMP domain-containing sensor histidine kinase [Oerskovia sp. M15]
MTAAARSMAAGDYSRRVRATSRDEVGQLAVAFNIMAEDLASSDQMRRELIANVSHELRTPIAALQAQLENVVDGVSEANPATMEMALAQTERLTRLVTYLLDLSRIEAGAAALNITDVPLGDFLEENADAVSMVEASKQLRFVVDVTPEDLTLPADPERLRQIITNLLQNAIRHSPQDGEIRLEAYPVDDDVVIEIIDQGPGIAKKDRERIFERFARGNAPSHGHTSTGGTGIGLAIVRWAVDLHGGRIEVADSLQGATMRLTFPAHPRPHAAALRRTRRRFSGRGQVVVAPVRPREPVATTTSETSVTLLDLHTRRWPKPPHLWSAHRPSLPPFASRRRPVKNSREHCAQRAPGALDTAPEGLGLTRPVPD